MHGAKQVGVPQGWGLSGIALGIFAGMLQLMMLLSEACGKICRSMASGEMAQDYMYHYRCVPGSLLLVATVKRVNFERLECWRRMCEQCGEQMWMLEDLAPEDQQVWQVSLGALAMGALAVPAAEELDTLIMQGVQAANLLDLCHEHARIAVTLRMRHEAAAAEDAAAAASGAEASAVQEAAANNTQ